MQKEKLKKRKGLLILSAFILSIILLTSWWLSNAWNKDTDKITSNKQQAFNIKLPDANLKEAGKNKLEIYMQAEKDSAKLKEQQKKDSSERRWFDPGPPEDDVYADEFPAPEKNKKTSSRPKSTVDQNEKKVNERLEKLYATLNNTTETKKEDLLANQEDKNIPEYDNRIEQLEKLLEQIKNSDTGSNPEMKQAEAVLDKILDIQYPERVKDRLSKNSEQGRENYFAVTTNQNFSNGDSANNAVSENAFWGLQGEEQSSASSEEITTISAVVHQDQLLQDGSVIKLRLLQDIFINNTRIPKDNFLYGQCSLGDQRLLIQFNSIAFNNTIYPVKLTAFDTDGNEGIYIPGAIGRDAAKNGMNDAIQQMQLATLNSSIGAQAATAGIQAAQNLLSKKVKRVQVTIKTGHKVLLKMKGTN